METVLQTYGLTKQYGSFTALSNLDLALERVKLSVCWGRTEAEKQHLSSFAVDL